ncbi:MAG: hypothetical protein WAM82_00395 [Thermoanaerobaculia bacterium]
MKLTAALTLFVSLIAVPLLAQTNLETNAGVQFNFSTPGAGNLALGGAFLALAFDASAAYTNPAGLTQVGAPESLAEVRHWSYTHVFTDRGRIEGEPISGGFDDHAGLLDGHAQDEVTGLSYFSYVYPHRDWSFAIYRHELVNFKANFFTHGAYLEAIRGRNSLGIPGTTEGRLAALQNRMDLDIVANGGAVAYRLGKGLSLGLAVSYFHFAIDSQAQRFLPEISSPPTFAPDTLVNSQAQKGNDSDWGLAAGFLWESPRKRWSVGGVFRQGPDFTFRARSLPAEGQYRPRDQPATFHVPDVYGVGLAFQPRDALRLAFDYDRVRYSQLTRGFVDIFDLAGLAKENPQFLAPNDPELNRFVINDTDELHLGMEYAFLQYWPVVSVRLGAWYEPDHNLRFEGENAGFRAVFRQRGDQMHYTTGAGLAFRHIQVDGAVDYSKRVSIVSLSAGLRY